MNAVACQLSLFKMTEDSNNLSRRRSSGTKRSLASKTSNNGSVILNVKKGRITRSSKRTILDSEIKKEETDPSAPTDHYLLKGIKGDDEDDLAFILTENSFNNETSPPPECVEEIQIEENCNGDGDVDEHDDNINTKEIVEHVCGKCYKSFRTIKALKRHLDFCNFTSDVVLRRAEMLKNIEKIEKEAVIMEKKDVCFCCGDSYDTCHLGHINCSECPKTFKTQLSLERHMFLIHSEKNDFPCGICNGLIRTQSLLDLHIEQHKNRGKPFACKECGKDFTRMYHLKRHHNFSSCGKQQVETMQCQVCQKEFFRLDNLRMHLKSHLGHGTPKKPEYTCPCCKKCFFSLSTLNIHIRTHTGERPFDCDLCDKSFPALVSLKKHRRCHTGEKPYTCSECNQHFSVKEVLNRHMRRHTGVKPHVCDECGKRFIQATQLKNHLRTHLRPYECSICDEKFKTEKQCAKHVKIHSKRTRSKTAGKYNCTDCGVSFKGRTALQKHEQTSKHIANAKKNCPECGELCANTKSLHFHMLKEHGATDIKCNKCDMEFWQFHLLQHHMKTVHNETKADKKKKRSEEQSVKKDNDCIILEEIIVDSLSNEAVIQASEAHEFTIIAKGDGVVPEIKKPHTIKPCSPNLRAELKKSLADCLRKESPKKATNENAMGNEDKQITENVGKLLDMLVDVETLVKFGWPDESVENVLCKVIENCGHKLHKRDFTEEYGTRMREFVKLLFTVVIQNDSIKELLNNYPIDEVIEFALLNDDDD